MLGNRDNYSAGVTSKKAGLSRVAEGWKVHDAIPEERDSVSCVYASEISP